MIAVPFLFVALIVVAVIAVRRSNRSSGASRGQAVRRFFQYALMLGMLVVLAVGLIGLLARLFGTDVLYSSQEDLARSLAFVVVGGPAYAFLALWARRQLREDPRERLSMGWAFYVSAACLVTLTSLIGPLHELLRWAVGISQWNGNQLASVLVWSAFWAVHLVISQSTLAADRSLPHRLVGSAIGLVITVVGLASTLGASFNALFDFGNSFVGTGSDAILRGVTWAVIGIPLWFIYWIRLTVHQERQQLWFAYVFLAGIAGGLITAVVSSSVVIYDTLVWFIGEPRVSDAAGHFDALGISLASGFMGLLVWWYHRSLIGVSVARTEVRRIYEYVMAAGGLGATATGVAMMIVALIEVIFRSSVLAGGSAINSLLLAVTLLVVGLPVWLTYWSFAQRSDAATEQASPTRRLYLFVLFGVGAVAAVISLLTTVYSLFSALLEGTAGGTAVREMRFSLAIFITAGAISGYHWLVYRKERQVSVRESRVHSIVVIGRSDPEQERVLAQMTHARVRVMEPLDGHVPWDAGRIASALEDHTARDVVVLAEASGTRVIPVERVHN